MINILVKQSIAASKDVLLHILLDHEQLDRFFNARFCVVRSENKNEIKGGTGCVRAIKTVGLTFQEQIMKANSDGIHYQIIGDFFLKEHVGKIIFSSNNNGTAAITDVEYSIAAQVPWYLPSRLIKYFVESDIIKAMKKLKEHFDES